mmetsp:Transcript_14934/g.31955  ORF Transcript_14934/g.31955 Transcript_14934/m.31955 type:complete len:89 (+) Transcript_14934:261-527(+)
MMKKLVVEVAAALFDGFILSISNYLLIVVQRGVKYGRAKSIRLTGKETRLEKRGDQKRPPSQKETRLEETADWKSDKTGRDWRQKRRM